MSNLEPGDPSPGIVAKRFGHVLPIPGKGFPGYKLGSAGIRVRRSRGKHRSVAGESRWTSTL